MKTPSIYQERGMAATKHIFLVSSCFGLAAAILFHTALEAANDYYGRQALINQEQVAWNKFHSSDSKP